LITDVELNNINVEIEENKELGEWAVFEIKHFEDTLPPAKQIRLTIDPEFMTEESA
jgi:hypothetical protein